MQAAFLSSLGVASGETVVLVMQQGIPLLATFTGAMMIGAVPSILAYPNFKVEPAKYRRGLRGVSEHLDAAAIVVDDAFPADLLDFLGGAGARIVRAREGAQEAAMRPAGPDALAFLQHSSGTTGLQKGVALSHGAVMRQLGHLAEAMELTPEDRVYSWLPLYHDMGLIACFLLPLAHHVPLVMQSPTDWILRPESMLRLIARHRCTTAWVPNFALQFLARRVAPESRAGIDLSSMRALVNCSEPVRARSIDEFRTAFEPHGFRPDAMQSSYAMAENVFAVTHSTPGREPVRIRHDGATLVSSGRCIGGNAIRIVGDDGSELGDGGTGEIHVRSDSLFDGYHRRPDLTAEVLGGDGWYRTGDLGLRIGGELFVTGRKRDLIIVGGRNIHPHDVEEIAAAHPRVRDGRVVAFGEDNPALGTEEIVIVAELEGEHDDRERAQIARDVRNAVAGEIGATVGFVHLRPGGWIVKSTAGKPSRSETRAKLAAELRSRAP